MGACVTKGTDSVFLAPPVSVATSHAGRVGSQGLSQQAALRCDLKVLASSSAAGTPGARISNPVDRPKRQAWGVFQTHRLRLESLGVKALGSILAPELFLL